MQSNAKPSSLGRRLSYLILVRLIGLSLMLVVATVIATAATRLVIPPAPSPGHQWIMAKNLLLPIVLALVYGGGVRLLERRNPAELSIGTGAIFFPLGLLSGIALIGLYVLVVLSQDAGHIGWAMKAPADLSVLNAVLVPWLTATGEELLFRLILFRLLEEVLGTGLAAVISAALFGLAHAGNPGADPQNLLLLALGFGVLMAMTYAATRNLWAVVGLHMGWNFAEGCLFGLPNSGQLEPVTLAHLTLSGPAALTGGAFGPEGSLALFVLCVAATAIAFGFTLRGRRWRKPNFGPNPAWARIGIRRGTAAHAQPEIHRQLRVRHTSELRVIIH